MSALILISQHRNPTVQSQGAVNYIHYRKEIDKRNQQSRFKTTEFVDFVVCPCLFQSAWLANVVVTWLHKVCCNVISYHVSMLQSQLWPLILMFRLNISYLSSDVDKPVVVLFNIALNSID